MNKIEKKPYGYKLTFGDFIGLDEMNQWVEDSKKTLESAPKEFGIFVDMRTLKPLAQEVRGPMNDGQQLYKKSGMVRSVVIVDNSITKMQFKRIAKDSGIYEWERYIDASEVADWEKVGEDWITNGTDPDK